MFKKNKDKNVLNKKNYLQNINIIDGCSDPCSSWPVKI